MDDAAVTGSHGAYVHGRRRSEFANRFKSNDERVVLFALKRVGLCKTGGDAPSARVESFQTSPNAAVRRESLNAYLQLRKLKRASASKVKVDAAAN